MRSRWKSAAIALGLFVFVLFAYTPLLRTGLLARDAEVLDRAGAGSVPSPALDTGVAPAHRHPLESYSLQLSRALFGQVQPGLGWEGGAFLLRLENLALLLLGAFGLGMLTQRLLLPWCGHDQARAAARAAGAIFALHPLATSAVATLDARGDLIGLALGLVASAFFLKGRQDRRLGWTIASFLLCALGSFASDIAIVLPLFFAAFEFVSSHRYRPFARRFRTSLTTLVVFGVAAFAQSAFRSAGAGDGGTLLLREGIFANLASLDGWGEQLGIAAEKLGLLVLPANVGALGIAGPILAGGIFLMAMQPALVAARSAPRLWGWLLVLWFLALFAAELVHAHVRVGGQDIALAHVMLPSSAVMAAGLGIASTALSGPRRPYVAWSVFLIYAVLSFGNAQPWQHASHEVAGLRGDLLEAQRANGHIERALIIDPPEAVDGVEPVGRSLGYLLPETAGGRTEVRGVRREAFRLLMRQPEFDLWRGETLMVLVPSSEFLDSEKDSEKEAERGYVPFDLRRSGPSKDPRAWRGRRSPRLDLATESELLLEARAQPDVDPATHGPLSWSTPFVSDLPTSLDPVWVRTPAGLSAFYDLEDSFAWLFGGEVRVLLFNESQALTDNQIHANVPEFEWHASASVGPQVLGRDWIFDAPDVKALQPLTGAATFRLVLLDLKSWECESYLMERESTPEGEALHARRAADFVRRIGRRGGGPLVWSFSYEIGGVPLRRMSGRLDS